MRSLGAHTNRLTMTLACAGAAMALAPMSMGGVTISEIAPPTTIFIAGTNNFAAMQDAIKRAGLMDIWEDPSIRNWVTNSVKEGMEDLESHIDDLGFDIDDLSPPKGPFGVAVFMDPTADPDVSPFNALMIADFEDEAGQMREFITAAIEESERKGEIELSEEMYRDVTIYTIEELASDDADEWGDDEMEWEEDWGDSGPGPLDFESYRYAWSGSSLVWGTNLDAVQDSIDRLAGQEIDNIANDRTYLDALAMVGKQEAFAVVRTAPLFRMMDRNAAEMGGGDFVGPVLEAAGIKGIKAVSMGMTFDAPDAVSEWSFAALAPNRTGIFELFENPAQPFTPPSFAGGDAMSLAAFQFDFAGVVPLVRKIVGNLPAQMQEMANMQLPQFEMMAGPILANLGPRVYTVQSITRPYSAQSQQMLVAIQAKDEAALSQTIAGFAPMMQFQAREFMGGQIWAPASTMPGMPEMALGVASGHVFIGPSRAIEGAIRTASDANAPRLANEARVKEALAHIPAQGLGYTWSDLKQSLEYVKWSFENQEKLIREQITMMYGDDPEFEPFIDEEVQAAVAQLPDFMKSIPDLEPVYKVLGDVVSEYHFTDQGVVMKGSLLRAK